MSAGSFASARVPLTAGTILLLAAVAIWPWVAPTPAAGSVPLSATDLTPRPVAPLPPAASFATIGDRPLFSPTRRPAPVASKAAPSVSASHYRLVGLVTEGDARHALVAEGARRIVIDDGGKLDGWTVTRIEADRVVLSSPEGEAVLSLQPGATAPEPAH